MSEHLPVIQPTTNLGSVINKMIRHSNANTVHHSDDLRITKHAGGISIGLADIHRNLPNQKWNYLGEWNPNNAYDIGDVVRVLPEKTFADYNQDGHTPSPGLWVCVYPIISLPNSDAVYSEMFPDNPPDGLVRLDGINYDPIWPEPVKTWADLKNPKPLFDSSGNIIGEDVGFVWDSDPVVRASIRYWELLAFLESSDSRWA